MTGEPPVDPAHFWERPPHLLNPQLDWVDPASTVKGMLSADWIQFYVEKLHLIHPFSERGLKPASYSLTLGPLYQIDGKNGVLTELQPTLVIPRNSIVFVSMREALRLPHYMAARFNLAIEFVYQGLLLGTGPQVDPGFQGVLSCPLHNISNGPIRINLGDHFATIDFIKTTGLAAPRETLARIQSEEELYARKESLTGHADYPNQFFKADKRWLRPIIGYPPGKKEVGSSVRQLEKTVKRFRRFGIGSLIAAIALAVTIVAAMVTVFMTMQTDVSNLHQEIRQLRSDILTSQSPTPGRSPTPSPTQSGAR